MGKQLWLFDASPQPRTPAPPGPVAASDAIRSLARDLPSQTYLGTSSWSFPGWRGIVYDGPATETQLAQCGLGAYAQHPLLRAVGIDRTYYAPISAAQFAEYAAATPASFRFLVKAPEILLLPRFAARNRYSQPAGSANDSFLNPQEAIVQLIEPCMTGLGERAGPIVFQFSPLNVRALGGPNALIERLRTFLLALPRGPLYAVELRNKELLRERYVDALSAAECVHCFNVHPSMPCIEEQIAALGELKMRATVARWMLGGGQEYEAAKQRYSPFDRLVDEDPQSRESLARLALDAVARDAPIYVIVNNKAEGSAPLSVFKLAERIIALRRVGGRIELESRAE